MLAKELFQMLKVSYLVGESLVVCVLAIAGRYFVHHEKEWNLDLELCPRSLHLREQRPLSDSK